MAISNKDLMAVASIIAACSKAERNKVGAVLVKDNRIISTGYNGTLEGLDNVCEDENGNTKDSVAHAEENAIINAYKNGISDLSNCVLYVTLSPCANCCRLIYQAGIQIVYYKKRYRLPIQDWARNKINFIKI